MGKLTAALLLACAVPAFAAGPGGDALPFLKLDAGARPAALGGAYSALGDDAFTVFYNPAGAAFVDRKEAAFTHHMWLEGMSQESLAYVHPASRRLSFYGGANLLLSGAMDRLDNAGLVTGDQFSARDGEYFFGATVLLARNVFAGGAFKAYSQTADNESAFAYGGDLGLLATTGDLRFGASASNMGARLKFGDRSFPLPLVYRAGAAKALFQQYWLTGDWVRAGAADGYPALGAEGEFEIDETQALFVRLGWNGGRSRNAGSGFTCGAGLRNYDLRLDYAFSPFGDLGASHRFSFTYSFGQAREKMPVKRGYPRTYDRQKRTDPVSKRKKQAEEDAENRKTRFTW